MGFGWEEKAGKKEKLEIALYPLSLLQI